MALGYVIATLVFIITIFFAAHPIPASLPILILRIPVILATEPILAIALLWATHCLDCAVIRSGIIGADGVKPYNILLLLFSLAYLTTTLDVTGILQAAAFWVNKKGGYNGLKLYLFFYVMFTLLSVVLGNHTVIISRTAYLVHYTALATLDLRPWIMAEFAAANTASMVLFVGNPTNMVICESSGVNNAVFTAYTILPFLACNLVCFAALAFQHKNQIPRKLTGAVAHQDSLSAVLDPVGAWVGGFMVGAALILCLVVGFFGIDVWMISLPFAIVKFLFDLAWDHYRYSHGIPMLCRSSPKAVGKEREKPSKWNVAACLQASSADAEQALSFPLNEGTVIDSPPEIRQAVVVAKTEMQPPTTSVGGSQAPRVFRGLRTSFDNLHDRLDRQFPTSINALSRLPFELVPLLFSQFILVEALRRHGWIDVFASWLVQASDGQLHPTIWLVGVVCVVLCNLMGTNVGAAILLAETIRTAALSHDVNHGVAIALAVASNIGAVGFTFSASPSGLLWRAALKKEGVHVSPWEFAIQNVFPLSMMVVVGLGAVSAEMAVLFHS